MPTVTIPVPYRGPTRGESEIRVDATTVRECLEAVDADYPGFGDLVFDAKGDVHRFVKLFVNEEPVALGDVDQAVQDGDQVAVVAAIGGG